MKNLKHIESDEDKIKRPETNVDNLNMRLKKANDIGYVSGLIIVFLLICCFVLGIYSSKSDAKNRVLNSINDKIKRLETNVDNLNMRLKKANDIGYVSGLIIK